MKSKSVIINFIWKFMERGCAQIVNLAISLILARLIDPEAYGVLALATIFTNILQVFIDCGLGVALVQKKEADDLDFSSVFLCNVVLCCAIYAVLFFAAPLISRFYETPELTTIVRVVGLTIVISGVRSIQQAYVERNMQFKKFFLATLISTVVSGVVGLVMAYCGFGVWALVIMNLCNVAVGTAVLWFVVEWRPKLMFSARRMKPLLRFGWKVLGSGFVTVIYANSRQLLVGKFYTNSDLAFYNKGNSLPNCIVPTIQSSITSVLLPAISQFQTDLHKAKEMTWNAVRALSCVLWPVMIGLAACSDTFIQVVMTEKWLPAVPFMRIFCIEAAIWPISSIYVNTIRAVGRSDIDLTLQTVVRVIGITSLLLMIKQGPLAIAICTFGCSILENLILMAVNKKLLNTSIFSQLKTFGPFALLSFVMGAAVYAVEYLPIHGLLLLGVQILVGMVVYALLLLVFQRKFIKTAIGIFKKNTD